MQEGSSDKLGAAVTAPSEDQRPYQFTLRWLFGVTTVAAVGLSVCATIGWWNSGISLLMVLAVAAGAVGIALLFVLPSVAIVLTVVLLFAAWQRGWASLASVAHDEEAADAVETSSSDTST